MTKTGMIVGTLDYIAPEQVEGRAVDARADVYALGCVTYEMLSGSVPFPRPSDIAKMFAHVNDPPPPLEDVPAPLAAAVRRAMAKSPDDRFSSAGDFGRAVLAGAAGRVDASQGRSVATGAAAPPPSAPGPGSPSRRPSAIAGGAVALAAVIGVAVALASGGSNPGPTTPTTTTHKSS